MHPTDLCHPDDITRLVHDFYRRVRADSVLGPIFEAHIDDWDEHLDRMVSFWSSLLLRTGTYSGMPMPRHVALPDLRGDMFVRWLQLFRQTTDTFNNPRFAEQANEFANRIARSLWYGYQINHAPDRSPTEFDHVPTDAN